MWDRVASANETVSRVDNRHQAAAGLQPERCGHYNYWLECGCLEPGSYKAVEQVAAGYRAEVEGSAMAARARGTVDPDNSRVGSYVEMRTCCMVLTTACPWCNSRWLATFPPQS